MSKGGKGQLRHIYFHAVLAISLRLLNQAASPSARRDAPSNHPPPRFCPFGASPGCQSRCEGRQEGKGEPREAAAAPGLNSPMMLSVPLAGGVQEDAL